MITKRVNPILVEERHQKILEILDKESVVTIDQLKKILSVSESTLRNDLRFLEERRKLKRSHGGALKIDGTEEVSYSHREVLNRSEKERIGKEASRWIEPDETVLLDSGSTVMQLAQNLPEGFEFNVVCSALNTALTAGKKGNVSVHLVGGLLRPSLQELVGPKAVEGIKEIGVNKVFLAASGLDMKNGLTENHIFSAEIKRAMVESANQVILLLDSHKMGKSFFMDLCPLSKVDVLITDTGIPSDYLSFFKEKGIETIIV